MVFQRGIKRRRSIIITFSENIIRDQARRLARADHIPEEFVQTASDIDDISQKYKDEIRNQTVGSPFALQKITLCFQEISDKQEKTKVLCMIQKLTEAKKFVIILKNLLTKRAVSDVGVIVISF